jgi:2-keto-4-pentenoate hydratase/2-oxohepta-3-ene-1,7-dioic acid hydratase in catechol pathway
MRLASIEVGGEARTAVVDGDGEVVDLHAADPRIPTDMRELLAGGPATMRLVQAALREGAGPARRRLQDTVLAAPVRPSKFFAVGLNYAEHLAEGGRERPADLVVFAKAVSCVTGPYSAVERPVVSDQLDYEGELGVVIGRRCRNVRKEGAADVVGGYVVVNDVTVRDWQKKTPQWTLGKSFDTHGPLGPWIVTPDEIEDPHALDLRLYVNGELRQSSNTRQMLFDVWEQIAVLSTVCTLEPGDVIATGTPAGVGAAMTPPTWLVPGDVVRVEIDGIGALENTVVQGSGAPVIGSL